MSTSGTRVFGIKVGLDPKILVGGLVAIAAVLFWYNSRSEDVPSAPVRSSTTARSETSTFAAPPAAAPAAKSRASTTRRSTSQAANDRGALRLRPVDATRGDIDPTLHLNLLSRLQAVEQVPSTRSLFEIQVVPPSASAAAIKGPVIMPKPLPAPAPVAASSVPPAPTVNVPLRYYGFVRPAEIGKTNSGLFLDGDNVLVVSEGQVVKQRFLIVELTPTNARVEDVQLRQGQTLPVVPVAMP